jgi:DNA-binding transcriptional LysR family regulator
MSKLDQIATFIAVVEANSFAAAARKLGLSTAAISRQVSRLESTLGIQLLQRTTRQLSLTDLGQQYFQQCKKALGEITEAENAITNSQQEATGILSVTSSRYFAEEYILPTLGEFMAQNPKLQIKFELAERFPNLSAENIDLVFGVSLEGPPGLVRRQVKLTRYVLCASPDYLKKFGTPTSPQDLIQHRYITHSMRQPANVIAFKHEKKIIVDPILWMNDSRAMRECAIQGLGIVKLHDYIVADALQKKKLIEILADFQEPELPVFLYYQQARYVQPKIRKFIDFFVEGKKR